MKVFRIIPALLMLAVAAPGATLAQEGERQREMEEAQRKVEEAQRQLERALRDLRASESDRANESLREALDALRAAQRELRQDEYRGLLSRLYVGPEGERSFNILVSGRPRMGVILSTSTNEMKGAVVEAVTPGGPAEEAGIKVGDVIVLANGQSLRQADRRDDSPNEKLVDVIRELESGDQLEIEYEREGELQSARVTVRNVEPNSFAFNFSGDSGNVFLRVPDIDIDIPRFDPKDVEFSAPMIARAFLPFGWLDMELTSLDEGLGKYFGTSEGLLVVRAPRDEDIGLESGDVILSIDGRKPTSPSHAWRIMRSYELGESMDVEIMRNKRRQTVQVTIPERERGFFWREENR
ncbi:MAG: PDZ domain-containing protein [Gemmatimonadota bacterium]|nr:PDZ domain-containing protein [Gemmatimonadota bacterium]